MTQTTETPVNDAAQSLIPALPAAESIPPAEIGHSLLALIHTHAEASSAAPPDQVAARSHSLEMAELYTAISELLNLLHDRLTQDSAPVIPPQSLEPLATSITAAFQELNQRLHATEERQLQTFESALRQWESERQSQAAENLLQIETFQLQAQVEVNRLLRVMWLGTGLAAAGAGIALILLS